MFKKWSERDGCCSAHRSSLRVAGVRRFAFRCSEAPPWLYPFQPWQICPTLHSTIRDSVSNGFPQSSVRILVKHSSSCARLIPPGHSRAFKSSFQSFRIRTKQSSAEEYFFSGPTLLHFCSLWHLDSAIDSRAERVVATLAWSDDTDGLLGATGAGSLFLLQPAAATKQIKQTIRRVILVMITSVSRAWFTKRLR